LVEQKRRNPRVEVKLAGTCSVACDIQDISLSGLKFTTTLELKPGAFADVVFGLPESASHLFRDPSDRTIRMKVHVKWCQPIAAGLFAVGAEVFMMLDGTEEPFYAYVLRALEGRGE